MKSPGQNSARGYLSIIGKVGTVFEQNVSELRVSGIVVTRQGGPRDEENAHGQYAAERPGWPARRLASAIPARRGYRRRLGGGGGVAARQRGRKSRAPGGAT